MLLTTTVLIAQPRRVVEHELMRRCENACAVGQVDGVRGQWLVLRRGELLDNGQDQL